jgi:hypothetical protein
MGAGIAARSRTGAGGFCRAVPAGPTGFGCARRVVIPERYWAVARRRIAIVVFATILYIIFVIAILLFAYKMSDPSHFPLFIMDLRNDVMHMHEYDVLYHNPAAKSIQSVYMGETGWTRLLDLDVCVYPSAEKHA